MKDEVEEDTESHVRLCIECAAEIPLAARKCKNCGSFQDSRRFMTMSQSSVTFFLALLALLAHFTGEFRGLLISLGDWASGTNFSLSASLVNMDETSLDAILTSRRNHAIAISSATCLVHIPADRDLFIRLWLSRRGGNLEPVGELMWMGPIQVSYRVVTPEYFQPFETRIVKFQHEWTGLELAEVSQREHEPKSFCSFGGADQHNLLAGSALIIRDQSLVNFESLSLNKE